MRLTTLILVVLTSAALSQSDRRPHPLMPPVWTVPQNLKPTVPTEMISSLSVGNYEIRLEETTMKDAEKHLGGEIRAKGDAANALQWLCFHGADSSGSWVLWLESREIDVGYVGGFQWQRLSKNGMPGRDCHMLKGPASKVILPVNLRLNASRDEVLKILSPPTFQTASGLVYLHEHEVTVKGQPFVSSNIVSIQLKNGRVQTIRVSKTTSS